MEGAMHMAGDQEAAQPGDYFGGYYNDPSVRVGVEAVTGADARQRERTPVSSMPLPPVWPMEGDASVSPSPAADRAEALRGSDEAGVQPSVEPGRWVQEPDFWEKETMIAMTGRHPVPRPKTRPLPPPQRFRPMARWKSMLALGVFVVVTALACAGGVALGRLSMESFGPTPTARPTGTHTPQPTISSTKPAHK
jgi:hypothetical protein